MGNEPVEHTLLVIVFFLLRISARESDRLIEPRISTFYITSELAEEVEGLLSPKEAVDI
jgi:hypothetical protein